MRCAPEEGREVARLVDAEHGPGQFSVGWNARDGRGHPLGAGVYFASLEWRGEVRVQRLVALE